MAFYNTLYTNLSDPELICHPEVEIAMQVIGNEHLPAGHCPARTILDVLEIYPNGKVEEKVELGREAFADYCGSLGQDHSLNTIGRPLLRVFFVQDLFIPLATDPHDPIGPDSNATYMGDATALLLHRHFGIPMLFLRDLIPVTYLRTLGNARFVRKNKEGKKISIDGYYQLSANYMEDRFSYAWFSQSLQIGKTSNYFIHGCPTETRRLIMECANGSTPLSLARPFSIDAFLINDTVTRMNNLIIEYREPLILLEKTLPAELLEYESTPQVNNVVRLHSLLRKFQLMKDTLETVSSILDFVIETLSVLSSLSSPDLDTETVEESLSLIQSKASWSIRQLSNLEDRSNVRIALLYNLENQRDSQINLKIARLTAQISMVSQKDSSAMITMAAVTMFFLPGTFVSAVFSTVFFITSADGNLSVAPFWWLFPAITIPLTVVVFLTWIAWFRHRHTMGANSLSVADLQVGIDLATQSPVLPPLRRPMWARLFGNSLSRIPSSPGVVDGYKYKKDV